VSSPSEQAINATATTLVEVAARLLDEEGEAAVTARRVTAEAGLSTMAVYTHFGSMDDLLAAVRREGFRRFGIELARPSVTADPVADLMAEGWAYRHFALQDRHLYQVMFRSHQAGIERATAADAEASMATFGSLLTRIERCAELGRWQVDDVLTAGEVVWSSVHGHSMIELYGYHESLGRDPVESYAQCLLRTAVGFGDVPTAGRASLAKSRSRAKKAGQLI
jgi:AcrR family transcriptional regulator